MPTLFGKNWPAPDLRQRTGDMSQFGGITRSVLDDGAGRGVRVATMRTGTGLEADVLLDRCMDIGRATFRGSALAFRSYVGDTHPGFYDPNGAEWLRTFGGGLLATCGLQN